MSRVAVLTGGPDHTHDFGATGSALADLVRGAGHEVTVFDHPDDAAASLDDRADALVVSALHFTMAGDAYAPWRHEWAYSTHESTKHALAGFVSSGGGLVANHTAVVCFDDWPEWGDLVGGAWEWGVSSHPPYGRVEATIVADHPVVAGLPSRFSVDDEVYGDLDLRDDLTVLATAKRTPEDADQPIAWAHRFGEGRVVYDGLGHDVDSIRDEHHARLLVQALTWVLEREEGKES